MATWIELPTHATTSAAGYPANNSLARLVRRFWLEERLGGIFCVAGSLGFHVFSAQFRGREEFTNTEPEVASRRGRAHDRGFQLLTKTYQPTGCKPPSTQPAFLIAIRNRSIGRLRSNQWKLQSKLKSDEEWTYDPAISLEDLETLREVIANKHQRRRLPYEHVLEVDALIAAAKRR